jgi:hypothetical protein
MLGEVMFGEVMFGEVMFGEVMLRDDLCVDLRMDEAVLDQLGGQVDRTVPAPGYQARQLPVHVVLIRNIHL